MRNLLWAVPLFCLALACSSPDGRVTGSSSRVGNAFGVTGAVTVAGTDEVAPDAQAVLFSITADDSGRYDWYALDSTVTDTDGVFMFEDLADGYYSVVFEKDSLKAFSGYFRYLTVDSLFDLGHVALDSTVTVSGEIAVKDALDYYFYTIGIIGMSETKYYITDTFFEIRGLAKGNYKIQLAFFETGSADEVSSGPVSLPVEQSADSTYLSPYDNLPGEGSLSADTVDIANDTVAVTGQEYDIQFVIR